MVCSRACGLSEEESTNDKNSDHTVSSSSFIIWQTEDGRRRIGVRLESETVWLTQDLVAEPFQTTRRKMNLHVQTICAEGELRPDATHKEFLSVRQEGSRQVQRRLDCYNLDLII